MRYLTTIWLNWRLLLCRELQNFFLHLWPCLRSRWNNTRKVNTLRLIPIQTIARVYVFNFAILYLSFWLFSAVYEFNDSAWPRRTLCCHDPTKRAAWLNHPECDWDLKPLQRHFLLPWVWSTLLRAQNFFDARKTRQANHFSKHLKSSLDKQRISDCRDAPSSFHDQMMSRIFFRLEVALSHKSADEALIGFE